MPLWGSLRAGRRRQVHSLARVEATPRPGQRGHCRGRRKSRDGTVAGALAPLANVVPSALGLAVGALAKAARGAGQPAGRISGQGGAS